MTTTINFNELQKSRVITNTSNFKGAIVAGIEFIKPVSFIKAYLNDMLNNGGIDYTVAKKVFAESGITKATINTQINLFKKSLIEKGITTNTQPKLTKQLKSINDLSNFTVIAINDKVIDKQLLNDDNKLKINIPFANGYITIVE